jgi:hypothetical protein
LDFTSARQVLSLPLLELHFAFISFSFARVSYIFEDFSGAVVEAAGAGDAV